MTLFHTQGESVKVVPAPWDNIDDQLPADALYEALLDLFLIQQQPELNISYKPYVLLFDEFYTDLYRIGEAQKRMANADRIIFMGTSFSVNITQMALETAVAFNTPIEIVDPNPIKIDYQHVTYHLLKASDYIKDRP